MSIPPLSQPPQTLEQWHTAALQTIHAGLLALDARMELHMTQQDNAGTELKALVADLRTHIDHEIAQLAAKVDSATELDALKADVRSSMGSLQDAVDALKADDEPAPPTP